MRLKLFLCLCILAIGNTALHARSTDELVNRDILMVKFQEQSLVKYQGGVEGLKATSPAVTGAKKIDVKSADSHAYLRYLRAKQDQYITKMSSRVGRDVEVLYRYDVIINGLAIRAQPGDLEKLAAMPEVAAVQYDVRYKLDTDFGPQFIGADTIWDGSGTGGLGMTKGEGVIIGVLDTGVNFNSPSFADDPADGHIYVNPLGSGNYLGWCDPGHPDYSPAYACNDKVIGAYDYADGSTENDGPIDGNGHGSHTASTSGGNTLTSPPISGVAPHATLIIYDVCAPSPVLCAGSATSAAGQQALIDGVDVINYSISGGGFPWSPFDMDSTFLDLVAAGAFVAASAGNSGPGAATTGHHGPWVATIAASTHDESGPGDVMAGFSSRGPASIDVIKPDLTAPGVSILAALNGGAGSFGNLSGTSMSSPHVAGAAALLKALHPTWTPPEIRSALMTTAVTAVVKENGVTPADPFDMGSGRVDLGPASQAGLVLHETEANFDAADPAIGGDPKTLNLATMMNSNCVIECTFTRTVRNARSFATDWSLDTVRGVNDMVIAASPSTFSLAAGATQEIEFTVSFTGGTGPEFIFGEAVFAEDSEAASDARFTFATVSSTLDMGPVVIESYDRSGSVLVEDVISAGASDLQLAVGGLVPVNRPRAYLPMDPTNGDPFDSETGTVTYWINGLVNGKRLYASTILTSSPDLDLFVGRDTNLNGMADAGEIVCTSATGTAEELCEIEDPADGNWWILVQNWASSGAPTDALTVRYAAVDENDIGNLVVSGPVSPGVGEAFDLNFDWDFGDGGDGEYMGVLTLGSAPGNDDDLGTVTVDFGNDRLIANGME